MQHLFPGEHRPASVPHHKAHEASLQGAPFITTQHAQPRPQHVDGTVQDSSVGRVKPHDANGWPGLASVVQLEHPAAPPSTVCR